MRKTAMLTTLTAALLAGTAVTAETYEVTVKTVDDRTDDSVAIAFESALSPARNPSVEDWVAGVCLASVYASQRGFGSVMPGLGGGCEGKVENGVSLSFCAFEFELGRHEPRENTEFNAHDFAKRCKIGLLAETDLSRLH